MASLGQTFDASAVEPSNNYDVLPPGKYLTQVIASEMRATKDGLGQYLYLELDVLEGQYAGRKLFDRLNLVNANPDAVEIAKKTLSQYASAELKTTCIRMGTARSAITSGCLRIASPWNANSNTKVANKAAIDQGPIVSSAALKTASPFLSKALRQS